ncbi:MAG: hypothetical protein REI64_02915 [Pedobacter sp.]|uniref:hypothetical protein n=1 Tax=Pedobacter sp. TaxID=1411316 RepID=UPI00280751AF|nr:hypothetical protein [Pedobacter sp.]MDQ8003722.1 hypothetical protein [Pedobacter sp.]
MQPFDLELNHINYAVFPEGNETYTIYKNGKEYVQIQKDEGEQWIKFDGETGTPVFEPDEEVNALGKLIVAYIENPEEDEDEEDEF